MAEALWSAVQSALDARRDPLGDAAVRAALESAPGELEPLLRLRSRLGLLEAAPRARLASEGSRARVLLLAAAALILALVIPLSIEPTVDGADRAARDHQLAVPHLGGDLPSGATVDPAAPEGRVLALRVVVELRGSDGSFERRVLTDLIAEPDADPTRHPNRRELRERVLPSRRLGDAPLALLGATRITSSLQPASLP